MKERPKYVIDTCSFTTMRRTYPKDVVPDLWNQLDELAISGVLISTEVVLDEIKRQDDEILAWAKDHPDIFRPLHEAIQKQASKILSTHRNLIDEKKRKSYADPFVIATAIINQCAVVTEEKPSGGPHKSKIPDVCKAYDVEYFSILEMFRREKSLH